MPKIQFEQNFEKSASDVYEKAKGLLSNDSDLKKLDSGYQCEFDDTKQEVLAKGKQFKALLKVTESGVNNCIVAMSIDIPLILTPLKGKIEQTLSKKITEYIG